MYPKSANTQVSFPVVCSSPCSVIEGWNGEGAGWSDWPAKVLVETENA